MLNGIGGNTIAVAKECLSTVEVQLFSAYRNKYGCLDPMRRADQNAAMLAALYANSKKGKNTPPFKTTDFLPYHIEQPITLEEAMASWG